MQIEPTSNTIRIFTYFLQVQNTGVHEYQFEKFQNCFIWLNFTKWNDLRGMKKLGSDMRTLAVIAGKQVSVTKKVNHTPQFCTHVYKHTHLLSISSFIIISIKLSHSVILYLVR